MKIKTVILALSLLALFSCSQQRKVQRLQAGTYSASISLPGDHESRLPVFDSSDGPHADTIVVRDEKGVESFIMKAVRDEGGEMVATDVIKAAVVTARFRNVAERRGKITIEFQIKVPREMQDTRWQLRFSPDLVLLGDTTRLEKVFVTGEDYRRLQMRGYQQYDRFLARIIRDTTRFIDLHDLELFLQRNLPQLYAFRTDSSFVSDEQFSTVFGVSEQEAVEHYTNRHAIRMNDRLKARRDKMYRRFVKSPYVTEGLRIDTVLTSFDGDFVYNYIQSFDTRPQLRKAEVFLKGEILEQDRHIYTIPQSEPLTFYISSLSSFADCSERYLTRVIERRAEANTACFIDFAAGKSEIDLSLGHNAVEISRIKDNLRQLLENRTFDIDSIVISSWASPEGGVAYNESLSLRRAKSASSYFGEFMRRCRDSLGREAAMSISVGDDCSESGMASGTAAQDIRFVSRSGGENWAFLDALVASDSVLSKDSRKCYEAASHEKNPDEREAALRDCDGYKYLREVLYPRLRVVKFDFHLHRKGMVKDTVHTTELDSLYMSGVQALRDRDYKTAVEILRPYADFNTAVAYCALDYNASALSILEKLPSCAAVDYMLAIVYSRTGRDQKAVQCYLNSCAAERSFVHRGNLDPEISSLIRRYDLAPRLESYLETNH